VWSYPSLIFFNVLLLTETLFTLLLVAFVLLAVMLVQSPRPSTALACGVVLGLGALTRSVLWPLPLLLCPLLAVVITGSLARRLALPAVVLAGFALVVGPWAVRNTRLQGVTTIVDTMGGMNLRMGNYEHTLDDRMWDTVALTGEKNWAHGIQHDFPTGHVITEGEKDKWAQSKALEYIRTHPAQTLRRSLIKFADFWGLEREFIAGVQSGIFNTPLWFAAIITASMVLGYAGVALAGTAGVWLASPRDRRLHVLLLLPALLITGVHTIAFGHSRYHIPLIPVLALFGAAQINQWSRLVDVRRGLWLGALGGVAALLIIWTRQLLIVDLARIVEFF
jgi:hypothetical protein